MDNYFIIGNNSIEIFNVDKLVEYNSNKIHVIINKTEYILEGTNILLTSTELSNKTIKFTGNIALLKRKGYKNKDSFLRKIIG